MTGKSVFDWRFSAASLGILVCTLSPLSPARGDDENLRVFENWIVANNPGSMLIHHLVDQVMELHDIRDRSIAENTDAAAWRRRQAYVQRALDELVGPFPEKTPLNSRVTGVIHKEGYRVEKVLFESMPDTYVVGCLFVPAGVEEQRPAILDLMGHYQEAFRHPDPLKLIVNLVRKGFVVLTIDPPGQGENVQYFDPEVGLSWVGYSVIEHSYFGNQCFLAGVSPARYFVWDAIRAVDFLASRPEVDASRIGVTGFSGGGTITSYVGAMDPRVRAAVPSAWSTASRRQVDIRGAADAETEFVGGLVRGITFEDLIAVRAPRPTLLVATTRDQYLPIQGVYEALEELRPIYEQLGAPGSLHYSEDDARHAFTKTNNEAIYAFFQHWLELPGDATEAEVAVPTAAELQVTPTGQLATSFDARFVFDANLTDVRRFMGRLAAAREASTDHLSRVVKKAAELSGYSKPTAEVSGTFQGRYQRDGYSVGLHAIEGNGEYLIPLLVFSPVAPGKYPAIVYVDPEGKAASAAPGGKIEQLVRAGHVVVAADVLGVGETKNTATRAMADDYTAVLMGKSVVGVHAVDIVLAARFARSLPLVDQARVGVLAFRDLCPAALHAAAFDHSLDAVALVEPYLSYRAIAMNRHYRIGLIKHNGRGHPYETDFMSCVAGALTEYDLPDLIAATAPRRVILADVRDQMWEPADASSVADEYAFPRRIYDRQSASGQFRVLPQVPLEKVAEEVFAE